MRNPKRALSATAAGVLTAATLFAVPAEAHAAARVGPCSDTRQTKVQITNKAFVWDVTQHVREENFSGSPATIEFEITTSTSRSNSVSASASAKVSGDAIFASFEASVGAEMGSAKTVTALTKVKRNYTMKTNDSYIFGQGAGRWTATATAFRCERINPGREYEEFVWRQTGTGRVIGYTGKTNTVVACKLAATAGSFAARLKAVAC